MSFSTISSAGRGDPYWYEWLVGLREVIDLLDTSKDVESVAFQVKGVKGWDDVVVKLRDGGRRCYQVKHTRVDENLTFGDLVQHDDKGVSLLRSLFEAWRFAGLNDGKTTCILLTNREAGQRWATTSTGIRRPPLLEFIDWLHPSLLTATTLQEIVPEDEFEDAWNEWQSEMASGTDAEQVAFLKALKIRVRQDDLNELSNRLQRELADVFGVSEERIRPIFDTLHRSLKTWTTGFSGRSVTAEELCSELALHPEEKDLAPAPPPPAPFFPSRVPTADSLVAMLQDPLCEPIIFLTAEPGAGKTSVLSWLSNRRTDVPLVGLIGARFFCFEPILPETPVIAPDASRVCPEDLWLSLLSQLREGLRGRLHELRVPLRNDLLTWEEARSHVLRLASIIGQERSQRFVIVIDGIDHAARASQAMPKQIAEFFASLPGPDELEQTAIRLLVAGQPATYYADQYPQWLHGHHPKVNEVSLPPLEPKDITKLYDSTNSQLPSEQRDEVIRLITDKAKGNTLATVFAVAETEQTSSLQEFTECLDNRHLADGLNEYYNSIWQHMLRVAGHFATGIDPCLVSALSLARRGLLPSILSDAFQDWGQPEAWWRTLLESLGPLLTEGDDGFRVRHNDVRVFLTTRFAQLMPPRRQRAVSQLVDYYLRPTSDRLIAHLQLFDLLVFAERSAEASQIFTVDWVIEGAAVGIETKQLYKECMMAVQGLPQLKDWSMVTSVACASATVARLNDAREHSNRSYVLAEQTLPPFLPTEAMVRPMTQWSMKDLRALVCDAFRLVECGEHSRALALLQRWLKDLNLSSLVTQLPDATFDNPIMEQESRTRGPKRLGQLGESVFEGLGELCCTLGWQIPRGRTSSYLKIDANFAFEKGYIKVLAESPNCKSLQELFQSYKPRYTANWDKALRQFVKISRWDLVGEILTELTDHREHLDSITIFDATWWALRSGVAERSSEWVLPLASLDFSILTLNGLRTPEYRHEVFLAIVNVARSLGWTRLDLDPGDIAEMVYKALSLIDRMVKRDKPPTILVLHTAALLGRIEAAIDHDGIDSVRALVSVRSVGAVMSALWGDGKNLKFDHYKIAAELAHELAQLCGKLGSDFNEIALDAARRVVKHFPVCSRKKGIWSVLERNGRSEILVAWIRYWLADDGKVWESGHNEADEIIQELLPLAESVGEGDLAQKAVSRLAWMPISYSGNKEYGFEQVLEWFREAAKLSPEIWRTAGWRLWNLCEICDAQDGDNRYRWEVRETISSVAICCGAPDWWSLIFSTLSHAATEGWHQLARELLVEGTINALKAGMQNTNEDFLSIWCTAISLTMWFNSSEIATLGNLQSAILQAVNISEQYEELVAGFRRTTRGRLHEQSCIAESQEDSHQTSTDDASTPSFTIESLIARINDGGYILPSEAAQAIRDLEQSNRSDKCEMRAKILGALGTNKPYAARWNHVERGVAGSVHLLAHVATDDELWLAVDALAREYEEDYWPDSVASNLDLLAIERAKIRGIDELLVGLNHHLTMHTRWAFGGGPFCHETWATLPNLEPGLTWQDIAVRLLDVLFGSNSPEVLTAAAEGMHSLVAVDGSVIPELFKTLKTEWQRRWLLIAAEAWAAIYPDMISTVSDELARIFHRVFEKRYCAAA